MPGASASHLLPNRTMACETPTSVKTPANTPAEIAIERMPVLGRPEGPLQKQLNNEPQPRAEDLARVGRADLEYGPRDPRPPDYVVHGPASPADRCCDIVQPERADDEMSRSRALWFQERSLRPTIAAPTRRTSRRSSTPALGGMHHRTSDVQGTVVANKVTHHVAKQEFRPAE